MSSIDTKVIERLKVAGLYEPLAALVAKESPSVTDVHVASAGGGNAKTPPKAQLFSEVMAGPGIDHAPEVDDDDAPLDDVLKWHADAARDFDTTVMLAKRDLPRTLKPMDGDMAFSPFSHDPQAMDKLRPDQVPRFLGALTDSSNLETRAVRLNSLHAIQNRVDPAKVEAFRAGVSDSSEGPPAPQPPKPLVVRHAGKNFIADGHHRLAAQWLNGENTADVKFLDLSPVDSAVKSLAFLSEGDDLFDKIGWTDEARAAAAEARAQGSGDHPPTMSRAGTPAGRPAFIADLMQRFPSGAELAGHLATASTDKLNTALRMLNSSGSKMSGGHLIDAGANYVRGHIEAALANRRHKAAGDVIKVDARDELADWSIRATVLKVDADKRLMFGWASVVEKNGSLVVDKQDDAIPPHELEQAVYDYVRTSGEMDDMHTAPRTGDLVESMVFTKEKQKALGIHGMLKDEHGHVLDTAWWAGWYVDDAAAWSEFRAGRRPELSIGGSAHRGEV